MENKKDGIPSDLTGIGNLPKPTSDPRRRYTETHTKYDKVANLLWDRFELAKKLEHMEKNILSVAGWSFIPNTGKWEHKATATVVESRQDAITSVILGVEMLADL